MEDEEFKTGMRVVYRNGWRGIVMADINVFALEGGGYNYISRRRNTLSAWDIVEVYDAPPLNSILNADARGKLVWSLEDHEKIQAVKAMNLQIEEIQAQLTSVIEARDAIEATMKKKLV